MSFLSNIFKSKRTICLERKTELENQRNILISKNKKTLSRKARKHPLIKTNNELNTTLRRLKKNRDSIEKQWQEKYEKFSWWDKLNNPENIDLSELDHSINNLEEISKEFNEKYSTDIKSLRKYYKDTRLLAENRINSAFDKLKGLIEENPRNFTDENDLVNKAFYFSILSIPVSMWADLAEYSDIYDSLRKVNSNFVDLSDIEIWWESLWMSSESLKGLASLTKGAYFEQLVAEDTGGALFKHFNNKDTDIEIDGILYQIKATDSVSYISSVDEGIPIITTSEIAIKTGNIDGGYENQELSNMVEAALGGEIFDGGDIVIDALVFGAGSLGFLAIIKGINHAQSRFDKGVDALEATYEGFEVAVVGSAKAMVDASEMVYKVITSRPSRFIGRSILKGLDKLGL